ncbi:MAG: ORC1-type DNA replication protein [Candidatus Bathyarchaeota archaeon]|nr:ORC1-type DNA replication protein [Candidatus Bathyarchaeota archaeon]
MKFRRSVFKDETKLDINYIPSRLPHREKEHRLLTEFFSFLTQFPERMAQRVIVTGEVGTGKTALCQRVGQDITSQARKNGVNVRYVHVNCREYRGKLSLIMQHAVAVLRPNFPKRGFSSEEILSALLQTLDEENMHMVLALDEFDSLIEAEGSDSVYNLTRMQEIRPEKPQRVSLLFIMRNLQATKKLDDSAKSTLQQNIIRLEAYDKEQLVDILNDRVAMAFEASTVAEDVVCLAADLAQGESGNARFAIELLWRAGKYADAEDLGDVTPECVRKAISSIIPTLQKGEVSNLGQHEKLFLLSVAEFFKENAKAYATLTELENEYGVICEEYEVEPVSHTQLWSYAKLLSALGVLRTVVSSEGARGRSTLVYLPSVSAEELAKTLRLILERERGA